MPEYERVLILQELLYPSVDMLKGRVLFKFLILVWKLQAFVATPVGQLKLALGVYEYVLFFKNIKIFVAHYVSKNADFCKGFMYACALYIEKYKFH